MIEAGIQQLVQANATVAGLCAAGGFLATVPKGIARPTWTLRTVSSRSVQHLTGVDTLTDARYQIDVFGDDALGAVMLAAAIDNVLNGFTGTLPDADSTRIQSCFSSNSIDFFDADARSYRRMLEYEIWFNASY